MKNALIPLVLAAAGLAATSLAGASPSAETPTLTLKNTQYGRVLFTGRGRVLYAFTGDRRSRPSRCYGGCARAWPVYYAGGALWVGKGLRRSLLGTTRRRDGRRQVTYNGWPLYTYAHEGPGQVKCQNVDEFGGLWLVVRSNGTLVR